MGIYLKGMDENMSYEKSCGAVVYKTSNKGIQYLLLKSIGLDSYWGFPKGHMEYSESEEETALREVFEECGLKVNLIDGFRVKDKYIIDNLIEKEVVLFLGEADFNSLNQIQAEEIQAEEIDDYRWSNYEEAQSLLTFDSGRRILSEANRFLCERFK